MLAYPVGTILAFANEITTPIYCNFYLHTNLDTVTFHVSMLQRTFIIPLKLHFSVLLDLLNVR